jgi:hypothetical protein
MDQYNSLFQQARVPAGLGDQIFSLPFRLSQGSTRDQVILGASAAASAATFTTLSVLWGSHDPAAIETVALGAGVATSLRQTQIMKITNLKRGAEVLARAGSNELFQTPSKVLNKVLESQRANDPTGTRRSFKSDIIRLLTYPNTMMATAVQAIAQSGHGAILADIRTADGVIIGGLATVLGLYTRKVLSTESTADGDYYASTNFKPSKALLAAVDGLAYGPFALGSAGLIVAYQLAHTGLIHLTTALGYGRSIGNIGQALGVGYERVVKALGKTPGKIYSGYDAVVTNIGALSIIGQAITTQQAYERDFIAIAKQIDAVDHPPTPIQGEFEHLEEGK